MPMHFGKFSIDEWNAAVSSQPTPAETVSADGVVKLKEAPSSARSRTQAKLENLTWQERSNKILRKKTKKGALDTSLRRGGLSWSERCPEREIQATTDDHLHVQPMEKERSFTSSGQSWDPGQQDEGVELRDKQVQQPSRFPERQQYESHASCKPFSNSYGADKENTAPNGSIRATEEDSANYTPARFPDALTNGKPATCVDYSSDDFDYSNSERLLQVLKDDEVASGIPILPVGLVNPSSTCYMNVILQSLYSCNHLTSVLASKHFPYDSKLLNKLRIFYLRIAAHQTEEKRKPWPSPLLPSLFYNVFPSTSGNKSNKTFSQEDAQEFFAFVLNRIHDEIVKGGKDKEKSVKSAFKEPDWNVVGVGGRRIRDRETEEGEHQRRTVASEVFGGLTLSETVRSNKHVLHGETHVKRFERFYSLGLEVGNGSTCVEEGLKKYFGEERLEGGMIRSLDIVVWPKVLVLQLMRFRYQKDTNEVEKVSQKYTYPEFLEVEDSPRISTRGRGRRRERYKYRLVSVVTHHGKDIASGHYTCDVWRMGRIDAGPAETVNGYAQGNGSSSRHIRSGSSPSFRRLSAWFNCDDSKMTEVGLNEVLSRRAYLLFYAMT